MKKLRSLFESFGCTNVSTYINSGNVIFESEYDSESVLKKVTTGLKKNFDFEIPTLVKTEIEIKKIAKAIPKKWDNDLEQRTDVAYLFPEIDSEKIMAELPIKQEFVDVRYAQGAIYWNVKREHVYKSNLAKLISHKLYKFMTVRNVNTARHLAENID